MLATCTQCGVGFESDIDSTTRICPRCSSVSPASSSTPVEGDTLRGPTLTPAGTPAGTRAQDAGDGPASAAPPGYDVLEPLGHGGMGFVFKARQALLDRVVAVKMLRPGLSEDEDFQERFLREARAAARLRHPHICPVHDVGLHRGQPYLVMDFIEGETLAARARAKRMTARESAETVARVSRAVAHAHAHGIIHRDLKPSNVMVERATGHPILMDFGLAKELEEKADQLTHTGDVMGTPAYMPPEQAAGHTARIGPRSDVYSLGAILYELLTERPPFTGTRGEVIHQVQSVDPSPPRAVVDSLHRDIETICLKALAKNPEDRYADATALAEDLERFAAGEPILARRVGLAGRGLRAVRRHPWAVLAALAAAAAGAVAAFGLVRYVTDARQAEALLQDIDSRLSGRLPTPDALRQLRALRVRLEGLDRRAADEAQQRVEATTREAVEAILERPRVAETDGAAIRASLDALSDWNAALAGTLREACDRRKPAWTPVFHLEPPYGNLGQVFDPSRVRRESDRICHAAAPAADALPVCASRIDAAGDVRLEARFAGWKKGRRIGLALKSRTGRGYFFVLSARSRLSKRIPLIGEATDGYVTASLHLHIYSRAYGPETRIRGFVIEPRLLGRGELLEMDVRRVGGDFAVRVNGFRTTVEDIFPHPVGAPGTFDVILPPEAGLVSLAAHRLAPPRDPSPIEQADLLARQGRPGEALAQYEEAARTAPTAYEPELRFKRAVCQERMGRHQEAVAAYEAFREPSGDRWSLLALFHLWRQHARANRAQASDEVMRLLLDRFDFAPWMASISEGMRKGIIYRYVRGGNLLNQDPDRARRFLRAEKIEALIGADLEERMWIRWGLIRADHWRGDRPLLERAAELAQQTLQEGRGGTSWAVFRLTLELSWLLRQLGREDGALRVVESIMDEDDRPGVRTALLVERARLRRAAGDGAQAEADVDGLIEALPGVNRQYQLWAESYLLKGMLAHDRGDKAAAEAAWRKGTVASWRKAIGDPKGIPSRGLERLLSAVLGSLSGTLSYDNVEWILDGFKSGMNEGFGNIDPGRVDRLKWFFRFFPAGTAAIGTAWRTPRGFEVARRVAYLEGSLGRLVGDSGCAIGLVLGPAMIGTPLTEAEEGLLWDTLQKAASDYRLDRLPFGGDRQSQAAKAYLGNLGPDGWGGLAPGLPPEFREAGAFFLALRLDAMGRKEDAMRLLTELKDGLAPDRPLRGLCDERLRRPAAGKKTPEAK